MSLTLEASQPGTPILSRAVNVRLVPAGPALWRIVDPGGRVIGHVQALGQGQELRYRAKRFHPATRAFRDLGEFWSAEDAVECIAFAR